ncbi:hypothetical protein [uncultured Lutibacter sp.]|uniref:hypothetical protein n=1 Tax=uncultured Lutibacter sp. TaxID=437739 RepID=UPI0026196E27|nr:hypothetical protein [uncultured Lutibacter sp.]
MKKLKSTYKIIPDLNLVIEFHTGILDVDTYIDFKKKLFSDKLFKPEMNFFIHHKNVVFSTTPADIKKFVDFIHSKSEVLGKRKVAMVTFTPNQVVSTTLYKKQQTNLNQEAEVFSTNESALSWLLTEPYSEKEIISIIRNLKNSLDN